AELFVTVWLGILTISTGHLVSASAGHEYPAFYRAGQGFALQKERHGPPLATMEGLRFRENETTLSNGDALFIYTDGVTEATSGELELFGEERMVEALNRHATETPDKIIVGVRQSIDGFVKDAPQFDDITMLCMRYEREA
ncbi:MAG: serine/threonine-protein phosphatase, partial [Oscillibacter sp.]|nr:serine/threonine-protein phosphatase [Oscillibacter sp.]